MLKSIADSFSTRFLSRRCGRVLCEALTAASLFWLSASLAQAQPATLVKDINTDQFAAS